MSMAISSLARRSDRLADASCRRGPESVGRCGAERLITKGSGAVQFIGAAGQGPDRREHGLAGLRVVAYSKHQPRRVCVHAWEAAIPFAAPPTPLTAAPLMLSVAAHCAMARIFSTCDGQWGEGGASQRKGQRGKEKEGLQGQGLYMWYRYQC